MNLFRFALQNLSRNTRRTLITLVSIGVGMMLSIIFTGFGDSQYTKMIDGAARMGWGHLSVVPPGYLEAPSLTKTIRHVNDWMAKTSGDPRIRISVARITGQAMAATANESIGCAFMAIDSARESSETMYFDRFITRGDLSLHKNSTGIVVGEKMADRLQADIGGKIILTIADKRGEIVSGLTRVSGVFKTGVPEVDSYFVLLPIDSMRKLAGFDPDEATFVGMFLKHHSLSSKMQKFFQNANLNELKYTGGELATWRETASDMAAWVTVDSSFNYLFQIMIFLLVAAGILNTILMSVLERIREFGVMLAVGMAPVKLFLLVICEAIWLAVFGLICGLILTAPFYYYLTVYGLDLNSFLDSTTDVSGIVFDAKVTADIDLSSLIVIMSGVTALTLLTSIYPAWRAYRVSPIEAIKTQ